MKLTLYKTLWGFNGTLVEAAQSALSAGFGGIEGPAFFAQPDTLAEVLEAYQLDYIAEICTGGGYVPERKLTPAEHLQDLEIKLKAVLPLNPRLCNVMAGCDAWSLQKQYDFFAAAMDLGARYNLCLSFETHRSRSLFTPWVTQAVVERLPDLQITADISHWVCVAERLLDGEDWEILVELAKRVHHVHARVGYPQGPQVPHPAAPEYADCLEFHQRFWGVVWQSQAARGYTHTSMTPEFGPDRYLHTLPYTDQPVADLWELNRWIGNTECNHFKHWQACQRTH
ncbi:sugar phosphate isomerase/epimerase family protein [Gilvimarinus agarilyticus]|uniref:sugar phosphate isomerase/epimerase family protein n=1 Tax=Gilvimarinus agarilyticus TaxID=679259 RepID=UPI00059FE9B0|nr:sugar phosphate isomerase/epimerase [Gilvimarinus agarilyticus]